MDFFFNTYTHQNFIIKKSIQGAQIKILMNYLQIMSIMHHLKINWSAEILQFITIIDSVSGYVSKIISFECIARRKIK